MTDGVDTAVGTVRITVTDINAAPDAIDDSYPSVSRIEPTTLDVLANDVDQDLDVLSVITGFEVTPAGNSVDCSSGVDCVFTPASGFVGVDSFSYTIQDPFAGNRQCHCDCVRGSSP